MQIILFILSTTTSIIGAISGIGGGIILKPLLDTFQVFSVETISFLTGITVLCMSITSLIRSRKDNIKIEIKDTSIIAVGSIIGGILGKEIFHLVPNTYQLILLSLMIISILIFELTKKKRKTYTLNNPILLIIPGLILGGISSFLGIGGGPLNIVLFTLLFSMSIKKAAINSLAVIFFSQTASLLTSILNNKVPDFSPSILICMILGGIAGGILGSELRKRITDKQAEKIFLLILILILIIVMFNLKVHISH